MYLCILNQAGAIVIHRNMKADADSFLTAIAPYRDQIAVAVECIFTWYWLADLCAREKITFVLGHALYMKAIHGGKAKNDKIEAQKIAALLRGGMIPEAYVYPEQMRSTRDLLRRRMHIAVRIWASSNCQDQKWSAHTKSSNKKRKWNGAFLKTGRQVIHAKAEDNEKNGFYRG